METFLIVLGVVVILLGVVVFSPVVLVVDTHNRELRVRWMYVLEFQMPLPGSRGRKGFYILRKPIPLRERRPAPEDTGVKAEEPPEVAPQAPKTRKRRRWAGQFVLRCLGDSTIRHALARQLAKLAKRMLRSVDLARSSSDVSLPDPALNGMLAGVLASSRWGRRSGVRVNFTGENSLFVELRFYPHRVFKAFLLFVPGLPYRALFRQWRAFSAAR